MKLSEIKGEKALDALADLIDPLFKIISDKEFVALARADAPKTKLIKAAIKNHKKEVIEVLAILDGEEPENYEVNIITLPKKLLELLNDPDVKDLFTSQGQTMEEKRSGSAMENTGANEA